LGDDTLVVRGGEALGDLLQAGEDGETGGDTLKVEGTAALTLAGFDTLVNGIARWSGNGKAVIGTGAANHFDLSGLTSVAGLLSLDAAGGNDAVIGSLVADDLRGGAGPRFGRRGRRHAPRRGGGRHRRWQEQHGHGCTGDQPGRGRLPRPGL
jgi:hypothetical protein